MRQFLNTRWADGLGFFASFGLVILALWIQTRYQLEPCPLCITQRIIFMLLGLAFLLSLFFRRTLILPALHGLQLLIALSGCGVALRHWWLQVHQGQMWVDCGVGFDYMFENFPLKKMFTLIFRGTGDCASIDWTLLGLSLPQLALIAYLLLGAYAVLLLLSRRHAV
jgi:disulfide bond formation protein DsbB